MPNKLPHFEDANRILFKIVVGPFDNNSYVLACRKTGIAALVDAANEPERILDVASEFDLRYVLTTHGHHDHVQAVTEVRERTGAAVGIHRADASSIPSGPDFYIEHEQIFEIGNVSLKALHTPGHTPGSTCFVTEGLLFSGDTLFPGGPGNTWGNRDAFATIIESIKTSLFVLPETTLVLPGHGLDTTIGAEKPHLDEWIERGW
ncbi:MAG: MBL fold metallo-hydrolase [Acidimicrobiia bacterium]